MINLIGGKTMCLSCKERKTVAAEIASRYQKCSKKEKSSILDEFVKLTELNRDYAATLLQSHGKKKVVYLNGKRNVLTGDLKKRIETRGRNAKYLELLIKPLVKIWQLSDYLCSKRLEPYIKNTLPLIRYHPNLKISDKTYEELMKISPATIDRLMKSTRKKYKIKGKSTTKPGTLLKHQIPIRTFSDWGEEGKKPGFEEIDLVAHCNGDVSGDFCYTLNSTDICTQWTVCWPIQNRAQKWALEALEYIDTQIPFEILGIDSDNGGEFINDHMIKYCEGHEITFTRSRPYKKNDNCFIEQKNYSVARRFTGYLRYDTNNELELLKQLYLRVNLFVNYFQPSMKLIEKTRHGSKVYKKHDKAKTPYQRVLDSEHVSDKQKRKLKNIMKKLDPVGLHEEIELYQNKLWNYQSKKKKSV